MTRPLPAIALCLCMLCANSASAQDREVAPMPITGPLDAEFETALGTLGLNTRSARFDPILLRFFRQGEFETPFYSAAYENPWRLQYYSDMWRRQFAVVSGKPSETLAIGGRMLGSGSRRTLLGNPILAAETAATKPGALKRVLEALRSKGIVKVAIPNLDAVPKGTQSAAALVLQVALDTVSFRRAAFAGVSDIGKSFTELIASKPDSDDPGVNLKELTLDRAVDLNYLLAGAHDLTLATQQAQIAANEVAPAQKYSVTIPTAWGEIDLSGGDDTAHPDRPALLIIDTGGNDTYLNSPSNRSPANWISVLIDSNGNDKYLSDPALAKTEIAKWEPRKKQTGGFGPGSAAFGVTILADSRGDDLYRTHRPGLGSARYGVSVLLDSTGNDSYDAYADAEGFAKFGVGILEDVSGDDVYKGFTQIQGCALTQGFAMLVDRSGQDKYLANDSVIDFPSAQTGEHNNTMGQGAASGRRADYLDGHSLAGGIGVLYDMVGSDEYSAGVFAQGVGYWEGVGSLWDSGGNDKYTGQWYVQGASAHFAIGYLEDENGDDTYVAGMNMAQGAGHDFGIGSLIEGTGDDTYKAPNLSLGAGNANGIGIFVDREGKDAYTSSGITLGSAAEAPKGSLREKGICLGVFIDLAGQDTYPPGIQAAKNGVREARWTDKGAIPWESQGGVFWDR